MLAVTSFTCSNCKQGYQLWFLSSNVIVVPNTCLLTCFLTLGIFLVLRYKIQKKSASQPLTIEEIHFSNPNSETGWF